MKKYLPLFCFIALCVMLSVAVLRPHKLNPISPLLGKHFPDITLHADAIQPMIAGRVAIINLFASWCPPCAAEHPNLMALQALHLVPIIGIAWKDEEPKVRKWLKQHGNPYDHVLLDEKGEATLSLSLTGVPETFIVDKQGMVAYHSTQPITQERLNKEIIPLVKRLQQ